MYPYLNVSDRHPYILTSSCPEKQYEKADDLTADSGYGSSGDSHPETQDKKRIKTYIDDRAAHKSGHGIHCTSLKPELIVYNELPHHKGRSDKYDPHIIRGIFYRRIRSSEKISYLIRKIQPRSRHDHPKDNRDDKAGGRHLISFFFIARAKHARKKITGTMSAEKTKSLDYRHYGKNKPYSRSSLCRYLSDKKSIRCIIYTGDQHADYRRYGEPDDKLRHRSLSQQFLSIHFLMISSKKTVLSVSVLTVFSAFSASPPQKNTAS